MPTAPSSPRSPLTDPDPVAYVSSRDRNRVTRRTVFTLAILSLSLLAYATWLNLTGGDPRAQPSVEPVKSMSFRLSHTPFVAAPRTTPAEWLASESAAVLSYALSSALARAAGFWTGLASEGSLLENTPGLYRAPPAFMAAHPPLQREHAYDTHSAFPAGRFFDARNRRTPYLHTLGQ